MPDLQYIGERPARYQNLDPGLKIAALELAYAIEGYEFGEESRYGSDCSGTLSYPFTRCGFPIRMTADGFFKYVFPYTSVEESNPEDVLNFPCAFIITTRGIRYRSGIERKVGAAIHVAPFVGLDILIDANYFTDLISPISLSGFYTRYKAGGQYMVIRYPSLSMLKTYAWTDVDGLDPSIMDYTK